MITEQDREKILYFMHKGMHKQYICSRFPYDKRKEIVETVNRFRSMSGEVKFLDKPHQPNIVIAEAAKMPKQELIELVELL